MILSQAATYRQGESVTIQAFFFHVHKNSGQPYPKVWGGGSDVAGGDMLFFGAVDKALNIQDKGRHYVLNKMREKEQSGYVEFLRVSSIDRKDAEELARQVSKVIHTAVAARQSDLSDIPDEHRGAIAQGLKQHFPGTAVVNASGTANPKLKPVAINDPTLVETIRQVQSEQEAAEVADLSW
jgi:hypothetical protein